MVREEIWGFNPMGAKKSPGVNCRIAKEKIDTARSSREAWNSLRAKYFIGAS
jgi:hypothetical protein